MDIRPKRLITRLLESAAMFALAAFLIRLGINIVMEIWWMAPILAAIVGGGWIAYRTWKNRGRW